MTMKNHVLALFFWGTGPCRSTVCTWKSTIPLPKREWAASTICPSDVAGQAVVLFSALGKQYRGGGGSLRLRKWFIQFRGLKEPQGLFYWAGHENRFCMFANGA